MPSSLTSPDPPRLVGQWSHSDDSATIEYLFSADGTYRSSSTIAGSGFPHFTVKASGSYKVSGSLIEVQPVTVTSNGSPGKIVPLVGLFDPVNDKLLLKQRTAQHYIAYARVTSSAVAATRRKPPVSQAQPSTAPGLLVNILIPAAVVAFALSKVALAAYKRRTAILMRRPSQPGMSPPVPPAPLDSATSVAASNYLTPFIPSWPVPELFTAARIRLRSLAAVYALAGASCSFLLTLGFLAEAGLNSRFALSSFFVVFAWPVVLSLHQILGWNWWIRRRSDIVYIGVLIVVGSIAQLYHPKFNLAQMGLAFLQVNALPTLLLLAFSIRRLRAIGPTILPLTVAAVAGAWTFTHLAAMNTSVLLGTSKVTGYLRLGSTAAAFTPFLLGLLLMIPTGWLFMRWISRLYAARRISDQSLLLDSLWLLFVLVEAIVICTPATGATGQGFGWVAAAFPAYFALKTAGLAWLRRQPRVSTSNTSLLVLRAFALDKRAARVFEPVTLFWRYIGDVRLIGGPDLASSTVQPHAFLDFASGKLPSRFIDSPNTLESRMADLEAQPDPDGRFRINDFFCYADTWQPAVSRLIRRSDVVLADLRGLTAQSLGGCEFEIREVLKKLPIERFVMLVDNTTDKDHLARIVEDAWRNLPMNSPNHPVRIVECEGSDRNAVQKVLNALFTSAHADS